MCTFHQLQAEVRRSSVKAKPAGDLLSPPSRVYNPGTAAASAPSLHPAPSSGRWHAGSDVSPASSLPHNTAVPPLPQDEHVEQINRLLEEVMMGLDIFPNSSTEPVPPASSSSCTGRASVKEAGPASSRGPGPQPPGETYFKEMLENFLSGFQQEIQGCNAAENEAAAWSQTRSLAGSSQGADRQLAGTKTPARSRPQEASAGNATRSKPSQTGKKSAPKKPQKRRGRKEQRLKDSVPSGELNLRKLKQLKQMAVVILERRDPLPDRITLQGKDDQSLNNDKVSRISPLLRGLGFICNHLNYPAVSEWRKRERLQEMPK